MHSAEILDAYYRLVEREDRLMQQRFSNLLTTQGLLFVALGLVADQGELSRLVNGLPLIGMAVSLSACGTIWEKGSVVDY